MAVDRAERDRSSSSRACVVLEFTDDGPFCCTLRVIAPSLPEIVPRLCASASLAHCLVGGGDNGRPPPDAERDMKVTTTRTHPDLASCVEVPTRVGMLHRRCQPFGGHRVRFVDTGLKPLNVSANITESMPIQAQTWTHVLVPAP